MLYADDFAMLSAPLVQAIEDAILLGSLAQMEEVLNSIGADPEFPENLRYGLEALLYFRMYYGKGGALEPNEEDARRATLYLEAYWGKELLETVARCPELTIRQVA